MRCFKMSTYNTQKVKKKRHFNLIISFKKLEAEQTSTMSLH